MNYQDFPLSNIIYFNNYIISGVNKIFLNDLFEFIGVFYI